MIVQAKEVVKTYIVGAVRVPALRGVDLDVAEGEVVAIMGHSGCGKTTLLNCLAGLDTIDDGEIRIAGEPLHIMSERRRTAYRARHMGFIFQQFNLLPVLSTLENVELPLLIAGVGPREARRRAREVLAAVDMSGRERHKPAQLSGGQQQRVSIARALVNEPDIIWADEPTGNLDSATATMIMDLLVRLNKENGRTFVVVTHDAAVAARAHRIVEMKDGLISRQSIVDSRQRPVGDLGEDVEPARGNGYHPTQQPITGDYRRLTTDD